MGKVILCDCIACLSAAHHNFHDCDNEAHYYIEIHAVDHCEHFEGGSTKAVVCMECFDAYVLSINTFIKDGMGGKRPPKCQGKGCDRYLVRTHNFLDEVRTAASYLAEVGGSE